MGDAANAACPFCQIVSGVAAAHVVFEDDVALAVLDRRPLLPGHCLLLPRAHVATFADLPGPLIAPLFGAAQLLARAVERSLTADGPFVAINTRVSQRVPHLHVHVVPRRRGDGLFSWRFIWKRQADAGEEVMARTAALVRASIDHLRSQPGP